jgi:hypothetical protein
LAHAGAVEGLASPAAKRRFPYFALVIVLCLLVDLSALVATSFTDFRTYDDVAYPDSPTVLRISDFIRTGHLYPDVNRPPYLTTLYGPLPYIMLSLPFRWALHSHYDPVAVLRLCLLGFFLACNVLVFFISKRLTGSTRTALLSVLFALSAPDLCHWPMRIRFDFVALTFALLSLWLSLRSERTRQIVIAGVCAGLAALCKQTFIAFPAAFFLWLLYRRHFLKAGSWVAAVCATVACGYGLMILREPLVLQHFAVLSRPVMAYRTGFAILLEALSQAKVIFFLFGAYLVWRGRDTRAVLIVIYALIAFLVGAATIPQIGGDINYFFEFWAVASLLASIGLLEVDRQLHRTSVMVTVLLALLSVYSLTPQFNADGAQFDRFNRERTHYPERKAQWDAVRQVLSGRRIFSYWPPVTLWSSVPEVPDPFLNSSLELSGTWDSAPIVRNVESEVYDAVVSDSDRLAQPGWRNQVTLPKLGKAVQEHYSPACRFNGGALIVMLPKRGEPDLYNRLLAAGCTKIASGEHGPESSANASQASH